MTVGDSIDYVRPGALLVPPSYFYFPDHITPFPPPSANEWLVLVLHFLSFIPVGFLLIWTWRPAVRVPSATFIAFGIAVVLALGKFLFDGRHTSAADLVVQLVGGLVGAVLGHWALRKARHGQSGVARWSRRLGGHGQMSTPLPASANHPSGGAARGSQQHPRWVVRSSAGRTRPCTRTPFSAESTPMNPRPVPPESWV